MGAVGGGAALGLGIGLAWPRFGTVWSRPGAVLDADFESGRFVTAGRNYDGLAEWLAALGGTEAAGAIAIGPYAIPGAPEHVVNGDFVDGTTGWTGHRGGTISVVDGVCVLEGNGGNVPGFAQAMTLQKGHAYQFRGRQRRSTIDVTPSWTIASASELGGVSGCHLPSSGTVMNTVESTFSADANTMYVGGRTVLNPSTGTSEYDDASIREVLPFDGFVQEGFAAIIAGTTPAAASGEKVVFEASCGGIDNVLPHERNRVRLHWDAAGHLRFVVTARNEQQCDLDLGAVDPSSPFEVLFSVRRTGQFLAALRGGPVQSKADGAGNLPGIARIYLKRQNATGSTFDGTIERLTLFPSAWSDAEFYEQQADEASIAAWGDSLTGGAGASGGAAQYPRVAAAAYDPNRSILNLGIGGQTSTAIAARQGGVAVYLTVAGNQVPASGPVSITVKSVGGSADNNAGPITDQGTQVLMGWLAGVYGTLSRDGSWNYTFTRAVAGSAVACPSLSRFVPELAVTMRRRTQWLWLGRNGVASGSSQTVEQDIAAAVAYLGHGRYLVGSILTSASDNAGSVAAIEARNATLSATYGPRFVDVLQALKSANDGSLDDLSDIASGWVPRSLRSDNVHLNDAGYAVVATTFKSANDAMELVGWA